MGDLKHAESSRCERHRHGAEESAAEFVDLAWHDESPDGKRTLSPHCRLEQRQISRVEFPGNGEADSVTLAKSTRTWMTSRPATPRSCRTTSLRMIPGCCAFVTST